MHESMHAIVALLLAGKITSIRLFPKIEQNMFIYGYVNFNYKTNITPFLSSIAPLFLIILGFVFLKISGIIYFDYSNIINTFVVINLFPNEVWVINVFSYYIFFQFIWGSFLSVVDIKLFFNSLFKLDTLIILFIIFIILKKYFAV